VEWGWKAEPGSGAPHDGADVVLMGEDLRHLNEWVVEDVVAVEGPDQHALPVQPGRPWTVVLRARRRGDRETDDLRVVLSKEQRQRLLQGLESDR
jgi:hypothetical protein